MSLQTDVQSGGKALDGAVISEKARAEIDKQLRGFIAVANNKGARDYFEKLPEEFKRYALGSSYGWQVEAALRFRA